ncbi:MAG TPA: hypothetical protein VK902_17130 [Rubrobacter sp.]|nr:hypothetical protein [Rubrobacter sp.]
MSSALTPTPPFARVTIIARTTSVPSSAPWCVVWRVTRRTENCSRPSKGMRYRESEPTPVFMLYTGSPRSRTDVASPPYALEGLA